MMKSVALLPRKADATRPAFHAYYESNHAPLALKHFPFAKYVRNHLAPETPGDLGFDTISEFWSRDFAKIRELMAGEIGAVMRADEAKFMGKNICSSSSEEHLLRGIPRQSDAGAVKTALLLKRAGGPSEGTLKTWGAALAADRVNLDLLSPWPGGIWPFDAIAWIWNPHGALGAPPAGTTLWATVSVKAHETSLDTR
ncbi:MAG: EthD family reductase [Rhodospirillaceae bacterium]|nr:EthD family reductase [Rhodospirillaceae bacterium]